MAFRQGIFALVVLFGPSVPTVAQHDSAASRLLAKVLPDASCATPRQAVAAWLNYVALQAKANEYLGSSGETLQLATVCMQRPSHMTDQKLVAAALHLKKLFDGRRIELDLEKIPDEPNYTDPSSGLHRVVLSPRFAQIWVEKTAAGVWMFPARVMQEIPRFQHTVISEGSEGWISLLPKALQKTIQGLHTVTAQQTALLVLLIIAGLFVRKFVATSISFVVTRRLGGLLQSPRVRSGFGSLCKQLGNLVMAGFWIMGVHYLGLNPHVARAIVMAAQILAGLFGVLLFYQAIKLAPPRPRLQ